MKLRVNLRPDPPGLDYELIGERPEVEFASFFLGWNARIENLDEGWYLPITQIAICSECNTEILQYAASSTGIGDLRCTCSEWQCPINMMSGNAYIQDGFKRVRRMNKEEILQLKLEELPQAIRDRE